MPLSSACSWFCCWMLWLWPLLLGRAHTAGPPFLFVAAQITGGRQGCVWQLLWADTVLCASVSHVCLRELGRSGSEWVSGSTSPEFFPLYFPFPENNVYELKMSFFLQQSCSRWPFHWVHFLSFSSAFKLWLNLFTFYRLTLCTKISWALLNLVAQIGDTHFFENSGRVIMGILEINSCFE